MTVELLAHVNALVADFAAEYGEVDLVGRRVDCDADAYDALVETFDAFGVVGGASIRVRDDSDRLLLARHYGSEGWVDPGDGRRPGESYRECAVRGVRETTGVEATVDGLAQIHLLYMDDWTERQPLPNPYVCFDGRKRAGSLRPGDGIAEVRWAAEIPDDLLYDELEELQSSQ